MGDTQMNRGAFFSIRDKQQIDKYDALNTYTIYLNSRAAPGFVDGNAQNGKHYEFTNDLLDNGSGHIKNAVARVRFIGTPFYVIGANNAYGCINWNLSKNQYNTLKGGRSSEPLTMYSPRVVWLETGETNAVPALATTAGVMNIAGPGGVLAVPAATNRGENLSTTDVATPILVANQASLSNVAQAAHNIHTQRRVGQGVVGRDFTDWVPCENPFGKSISITLSQIDQTTLNAGIGHAIGENTCIAIDIKLLPDNQANDRFTY